MKPFKHLILGAGNLGHDLAIALRKQGEGAYLMAPTDFRFSGMDSEPISMRVLAGHRFEVVWNTIGAGGPGAVSAPAMFSTHLMLSACLAEWAPRLICFSTHYLNGDREGRYSDYALSKLMMERALEKRENVRCLRVGSLYGEHAPLKTLPGKVIRALLDNKLRDGALNEITPTPTAWLARELATMKAWECFGSIHPGLSFGPTGGVTVKAWIERIVADFSGGNIDPILDSYMSEDYPPLSGSHSMLNPHWEDLWKEHGPRVLVKARAEAIALKSAAFSEVLRRPVP